MGQYKSQYTGPQIDAGVDAALNPDVTVTPDSDALVTSGAVADALDNIDPTITSNTDTTLNGILVGDGGKVGTKSLDTSSLTNDADHVPASSVVKSAINFVPETGNAGFHNSIYRGKSLGTSATAAQYSAISAGTFDDMYIGDYWTINSIVWRIAAFDYWLNCGDPNCTTHHVVIVPDGTLGSAKMNKSNVATGGYVGSDIYTGNNDNTGLSGAKTTINSAFGSAHILSHRELLTNAVTDGKASGWAWYDSTVELMNESMVYGHHAWASALGYETGIDKGQLPLFAHDHSRICNRSYWWLRDVYSAAAFARVIDNGYAAYFDASASLGVRPAFAIKS